MIFEHQDIRFEGKDMQHYFGTDGIRGVANQFPITAEFALKIGIATGHYFLRSTSHRPHVVIAKDTRLSGYMLEPALASGFISAGMDVTLVGPMPTSAVAMLTRSLRVNTHANLTHANVKGLVSRGC